MKLQTEEEKVKPFRLVKYFTFTSLIVIFVGTLALSLFNTHWAKTMQQKKSEEYARLLIENLNHQVFLQFIIPVALKFGKIKLSDQKQYERMDKVVRSTLHSFKVDMVNIYDMENTISYSFDHALIGIENSGGKGYEDAILGKSTSKLIQRGNWFRILLGIPQDSRLITIAPLRAEQPLSRISGPVLGVVEIVQDLTEEDQRAIAENLTEEQLVIFDLLITPGPELNETQSLQVKEVARELLETLKEEKLLLDWQRKRALRAGVRLAIMDKLEELPEVDSPQQYEEKCSLIYDHVLNTYFGDGRSIYSAEV